MHMSVTFRINIYAYTFKLNLYVKFKLAYQYNCMHLKFLNCQYFPFINEAATAAVFIPSFRCNFQIRLY